MDFLKNFPFVTREQYLWEWTIPQIRLANSDSTHINYLSEEDKNLKKGKKITANNLTNDLGIPIL